MIKGPGVGRNLGGDPGPQRPVWRGQEASKGKLAWDTLEGWSVWTFNPD